MLRKIKDGWYVALHLVTHVGFDFATDQFTYTLHGHEYSYQCSKDDGILLCLQLEQFIEIGTKMMQRELANMTTAQDAEQRVAEMKAKLISNKDNA